jgi:ATP-dependent helicase HrpB
VNPLPIDGFVHAVRAALQRSGAVVLTAAPGAGKTTRIPPALLDHGPLILLQPRRVAARAIAARIASEHGWTVGREIGWQMRFDSRFSGNTRLLVATEGILTARLQRDPLLSAFKTIVLDEFHERSLHADLAIALAKQAWRARDDLRLVVMSATLDAEMVSRYLDNCPILDIPGREHPIEVSYAPDQPIGEAVAGVLSRTPGNVLCFLPGAFEISRAIAGIESRIGGGAELMELHGSLHGDEQDRVLGESPKRRVVVATNIAETSLTVPGVTAVVDTGLQKVARYDANRGIDTLEVERITEDAARQRAGRAGRVAPGVVVRLWDRRDRLRPHREPEIRRVDLSAAALDVIAWGGDPRRLDWIEPPPPDALEAALTLLARLELVANGALTDLGDRVRRLPLHPRLARMLVAGGGSRDIARACAVLSERLGPAAHRAVKTATSSDLLPILDAWNSAPWNVKRAADEISRIAVASGIESDREQRGEHAFRHAILAGYPDRVAQRRAPNSPRFRLASGAGAMLTDESGVTDAEFVVALDVRGNREPAQRRGSAADAADARIVLASRVEREWLTTTTSEIVHRYDEATGGVRAARVERYDALTLAEHPVQIDPAAAAPLLAARWFERGPEDADRQLLRRLRFAQLDVDVNALVGTAAWTARRVQDITIAAALPREVRIALDRDAPETLKVPSGRAVRLEYGDDGSVSASVKLQELFGLAETPRVGPRHEPVRFALLAPNGRPVQVTRDLRSFWDRIYPEVRKELRGRYPKHPWPDDPWTATPSARTRRTKP